MNNECHHKLKCHTHTPPYTAQSANKETSIRINTCTMLLSSENLFSVFSFECKSKIVIVNEKLLHSKKKRTFNKKTNNTQA